MPALRVAKRSTPLACLALLLAAVLPVISAGPLGPGDAAAAGLIAPAKYCSDNAANGGRAEMAKARRSMICMVNYARRRKGMRPYHRQPKLNWSSGRKARDILRCGFSHGACGRAFDYWIRRSGYLGGGGWATGENIAWGSGSLGSVRSIFVAWMKSKGHREAILDRSFTDVGVGVTRGRFSGIAGARIWVLHFGYN
ncbi:MAG: hypothetical protein KDB54_05850 [Solirubrobacterales bacterium]|nr:hypothetical protein [Solirubrobacterales bacterium]MCB0860162.1 hypothetical protein [Solirubrobacterales bacterium]HRV59619.1 CAP domain-containing protein [Solirubrobacterales bacterium]